MLGDLSYRVWEIKALMMEKQDEASKILERISKQVQPIMRNRNWRVKLLSEFCPKNPALMGLNLGGGLHVKLRLRRHDRDLDFLPFDQVLDTMLHELCHNVHGPHNASFYKLWDEIRKECEELMTKGITGMGKGFDLPGRRLGGFSRHPPPPPLRNAALAAAENRARLGSLLPSGPKLLGGDSSIMVALSPIQAAAMAAERRLQDDIWCGSQSFEESGEEESDTDYLQKAVNTGQSAGILNLYNGVDAYATGTVSRKRGRESHADSTSQSSNFRHNSKLKDLTTDFSIFGVEGSLDTVSPNDASKSGSVRDNGVTHSTEESSMWQCITCTLLNPMLAPICELCNTPKPKDLSSTSKPKDKYKIWSCKFCTMENSVNLDKCLACEQWRYSYGPPVAAPAPSLGT